MSKFNLCSPAIFQNGLCFSAIKKGVFRILLQTNVMFALTVNFKRVFLSSKEESHLKGPFKYQQHILVERKMYITNQE